MSANKALLNYIIGRVLHCSTIAILSSQASNIITFIKSLWLLSAAFIVATIYTAQNIQDIKELQWAKRSKNDAKQGHKAAISSGSLSELSSECGMLFNRH